MRKSPWACAISDRWTPLCNLLFNSLFLSRSISNAAIVVRSPGQPVHFHFALTDCVLPAVGRDHPADQSGCSAARQICALHHDSRHIQVTNSLL